MRKQIITGMLLLLLLILPVSLYLQINQSFQQSVSSARESALYEEAAIARALMMEFRRSTEDENTALQQAAQKTTQQFGGGHLRILVYLDRTPLTEKLPDAFSDFLEVADRSTFLASGEEKLYVIHLLNRRIRLITVSDFAGFYATRRRQIAYGALICLGGIGLAALLSLLIARGITRRLSTLSRAADAVRNGEAFSLQPSGRQDEIGKLTDVFINMNDAVENREESLREQARQRQRLIDALAHEMRTPLTSVISAARLIQQDSTDREMRNNMCELIVKESRRLSDMDENLMKLTQMNGEKLKTGVFSLKEAAREALEVTPDVELSGEDSRVTADRDLIICLIRNLVNNARKSGTASPVRVMLHPHGFSVADEGRGMTEEELKQCREAFWKADPARTRASGGAGLGLTICETIARLHGASLEIRSAPGKGTTVEFTFPLHPREDTETADQVSCE